MIDAPTSEKTNKVFSNDLFKNIDTELLIQRYDISPTLRQGNTQNPKIIPAKHTTPNITSIPPEGIIIKDAGTYKFECDISWKPIGSSSAITIAGNNVTLDLNGHALTVNGPSPNTGQQFNGISIEGTSVATVKNGIIIGASYYGLKASKALDLKIEGLTIGGIKYTETTKKDLTACGIFIDKTVGFSIQDCTIQDITVTAPSCAGIQVIGSSEGKITACQMKNFLNNDGGVQGYSYITSNNLLTENCSCENFQSHYEGQTQTTGHTVIGYVPIFCYDLEYNNCSATGMTGCCDDCHGMSVFIDANVVVNNFHARNITDGVTPKNTGAKATGLEVYGYNITINSCKSENIKAIVPQDLQSAGFSAWGLNLKFNDCIANTVVVTDANQLPSTDYGYGVGYGWAPDPRPEFKNVGAINVQYSNCSANGCQVGFDTWNHIDSKWEDWTAESCTTNILQQPSGAIRIFTMDKCSELPSGMKSPIAIPNQATNNVFISRVHLIKEQP